MGVIFSSSGISETQFPPPQHLFWPLLAFLVPWVTYCPVLLPRGCPKLSCTPLSFCWTVPAVPSGGSCMSSVDSSIYSVFFCLFHQCKFPGPLLATLLWLMTSFRGGGLRCASLALFLNACIHEQSCLSLTLLSVSPEKNFKDWGWTALCFTEPQVEDLRETALLF